MDILSLIGYASIFPAIIYLHTVWAKRRVRQWALRNHYTIGECKLCVFNLGPFSYFGTGGGQYVFKIEAVDAEGRPRTGYPVPAAIFLDC